MFQFQHGSGLAREEGRAHTRPPPAETRNPDCQQSAGVPHPHAEGCLSAWERATAPRQTAEAVEGTPGTAGFDREHSAQSGEEERGHRSADQPSLHSQDSPVQSSLVALHGRRDTSMQARLLLHEYSLGTHVTLPRLTDQGRKHLA